MVAWKALMVGSSIVGRKFPLIITLFVLTTTLGYGLYESIVKKNPDHIVRIIGDTLLTNDNGIKEGVIQLGEEDTLWGKAWVWLGIFHNAVVVFWLIFFINWVTTWGVVPKEMVSSLGRVYSFGISILFVGLITEVYIFTTQGGLINPYEGMFMLLKYIFTRSQ